MVLGTPAALASALALAGLVAVYLYRNRYRRRPVSSLMLWQAAVRPRQGGARRSPGHDGP